MLNLDALGGEGVGRRCFVPLIGDRQYFAPFDGDVEPRLLLDLLTDAIGECRRMRGGVGGDGALAKLFLLAGDRELWDFRLIGE